MNSYLRSIYEDLKIEKHHLNSCRLPLCEQPPLNTLEVVDIDFGGRPFILNKPAADAWRSMSGSAKNDGVDLKPFSGFRSYLYQRQLIERKLEKGRALEQILSETAIPGFSEHHSGSAVDICTRSRFELTQEFEKTDAYEWLNANALRFNFHLSYPRDNSVGIIFEPWHWCYSKDR